MSSRSSSSRSARSKYGLAVRAPLLTLSFVFAMLGKSFRSLAKEVFPRVDPRKLALLALVLALAGCGGSSPSVASERLVSGPGYSFRAPQGGTASRTLRSVTIKDGGSTISVTLFRLAKPYTSALRAKTIRELDAALRRLAAAEQGKLAQPEDITVAGERARSYTIQRAGKPDERLVYVLRGKREYQLFCNAESSVCDRVF